MTYGKHLLISVLVLGALALPASAGAAQFHVSAASASLTTNTVTTEMDFGSFKLKCTGGGLSGTGPASGTAETQAYSPYFYPCVLAGFNATVQTNGCTYLFNANSSTWSVGCPTEKGIVFNASSPFATCTLELPAQSGINGVSFENKTPRTAFAIKLASTNMQAVLTKAAGACIVFETGPYEGTNTATYTVSANKGAAELWRE